MTAEQQANDWAAAQGAVRQRAMDGGGVPGFANPAQIQGKTGRQVLEAMMSGEVPYPHLNETMGFDLMEVGDGLAIFQCQHSLAVIDHKSYQHKPIFGAKLQQVASSRIHQPISTRSFREVLGTVR